MIEMAKKSAVVFGGTGTVGEGIVRAFLGAGAAVAVPSRAQASLDGLRERLGRAAGDRLSGIVGDAATEEGAGAIRDAVHSTLGVPDAVVVSVGGTASMKTPVLEIGPGQWQDALAGSLTPHFHVARAFLPQLADLGGASYTAIAGGLAVEPMAGTGTAAIPGAGLTAMMRLLFKEMQGRAVRLNTVMIDSIVTAGETPAERHPERVTAREVGDLAAWVASNEASMVSGAVLELNPHRPKAPR